MIVFRALQGSRGVLIRWHSLIILRSSVKQPIGMWQCLRLRQCCSSIGPAAVGGWLTENFSWHLLLKFDSGTAAVKCHGLVRVTLTQPLQLPFTET